MRVRAEAALQRNRCFFFEDWSEPTMVGITSSQKVFDLVAFRMLGSILFKISVAGIQERKTGRERAELKVRKLLKYTGIFMLARECARETAAVKVTAIRFEIEKITVTGVGEQAVRPDTIVAKHEAVLLSIYDERGLSILKGKHTGAVGIQLQGLAKPLLRARLLHRVVKFNLSLSTFLRESVRGHAKGVIVVNKILEVHAARE
jgi:hypothetical protein